MLELGIELSNAILLVAEIWKDADRINIGTAIAWLNCFRPTLVNAEDFQCKYAPGQEAARFVEERLQLVGRQIRVNENWNMFLR